MINLETKYAGLILRNPLIVGSSGLTNNVSRNQEFEQGGAGAIVLKSLFEEQIEMQSDVLLHPADAPEASDYVRNYVKGQQVEQYASLIQDTKKACTIPIIASINCCKTSVWTDFARRTEAAGADALELNLFNLCTHPETTEKEITDSYLSVIHEVRRSVSFPLIVKLSKSFSNIPAIVQRLKAEGVNGVVLFNRYYQPDIDINTMQVVSGQVFSSHSDLSDTLRWTSLVSGKVPGISIASSTGVHQWEDVIKCLLAGAAAVQLCSVLYTHGTETIPQMLTCLEEWMSQNNYRSLSDFTGKLSSAPDDDQLKFERAQFMKYYSNRD
ncbi:MAG: dihydroorotate dehydrogenase-like protein [Tannerella sp.]|jgi:dihydroorotate dehydrogenase (fumarate)|nr:dihydroorotate dehydrogenase-like protein [Tannerella sp.]